LAVQPIHYVERPDLEEEQVGQHYITPKL